VKASRDIRHPSSNDLIVKEGRKFTKLVLRQMEQAGIDQIPILVEEVLGRVSAHDVKDPKTGEVVLACNEEITEEKLEALRARNITKVEVLFLDDTHIGPALRNTLLRTRSRALRRRSSRSTAAAGDPPTPETATAFFTESLLQPRRYDLARGRLNHKLKLDAPRPGRYGARTSSRSCAT
jgi:DNA-directed RNA polymerase subunit beta